jgi:hypothetical protein
LGVLLDRVITKALKQVMGQTGMEVMGPAVEVEDLIRYGSKGVRRRGPMEEVEVMIGGAGRKTGPK